MLQLLREPWSLSKVVNHSGSLTCVCLRDDLSVETVALLCVLCMLSSAWLTWVLRIVYYVELVLYPVLFFSCGIGLFKFILLTNIFHNIPTSTSLANPATTHRMLPWLASCGDHKLGNMIYWCVQKWCKPQIHGFFSSFKFFPFERKLQSPWGW